MKALTEKQPRASLVAAGVKWIITRARPVGYRGRVAIYAAQTAATLAEAGIKAWGSICTVDEYHATRGHAGAEEWKPLPLGAVVASAVITDCAPVGGPYDFRTGYFEGDEGDYPGQAVVVHHPPMGPSDAYLGLSTADTRTTDITDQLPFGDFSPGRWALLLDDIAPTSDRCPQCWGEGAEIDGAGGFLWRCETCDTAGSCDPVPAHGRSGLWEWTR